MKWLLLLISCAVSAQTISEKKASLEDVDGISRDAYLELTCVNAELKRAKEELKVLYERAKVEDPEALLEEMKELRREIEWIEEVWRETAHAEGKEGDYALWHQPLTTLEQLIIDYGSADYLYIIPPEVGGIRLSVASNLPVPRESWDEVLLHVLINHGVGIRQVNPFVRELYFISKQKGASFETITADREALQKLPRTERVCFVIDGDVSSLNKFINPLTTTLEQVGLQGFLFATAHEVIELLRIYDFLDAQKMVDSHGLTLYTYTTRHSDPNDLKWALEAVCTEGTFAVYPKTGSVIMQINQRELPHLLQLCKRIDVPRKMVRIDVLFFEKKLTNENRFGLDLVNLGSKAGGQTGGATFNNGILQFMLKGHAPAFDLAYKFLLSQDDVQINAHPSVTTMNQTPAMIQLVDEISIDNGAVLMDEHVRRSFTREEYGITLKITPTVHTDWEGDEPDLIHLETDVLFDTIGSLRDDHARPSVARRHITNEVRVADGETVILGGLRSKENQSGSSILPFLGELPYIGKLFGSSHMRNQETEMFIFITPHIVRDPQEEIRRLRQETLTHRPGDTPEFLQEMKIAKRHLFERSLQAILRDG